MREILFRGKTENGIWVKGGFHKHETRQPHCCEELKPEEIKYLIIIDSLADWNMPKNIQCVEVIPETVGMFTGLTDKSGTKIFEGDIFKFSDEIWESSYTSCGTEWDSWKVENYAVVGFDDERSGFDFVKYKFCENSVEADFHENHDIEFAEFISSLEVIGNIHDNPELLGKE